MSTGLRATTLCVLLPLIGALTVDGAEGVAGTGDGGAAAQAAPLPHADPPESQRFRTYRLPSKFLLPYDQDGDGSPNEAEEAALRRDLERKFCGR